MTWCIQCGGTDSGGEWYTRHPIKAGDAIDFGSRIATEADARPTASLCLHCVKAFPHSLVREVYVDGPRDATAETPVPFAWMSIPTLTD